MNTLIAFTPSQLCGLVMTICGGIITVSSAIGVIVAQVKKVKAPNLLQNARLDAIEKRLDAHDKYFAEDKTRFEDLEAMMRLLVKANKALLRHGIDGNEIEGMKRADDDINNYLIDK